MQNNQTTDEANFPVTRPDGVELPVGTAHRSADEKSKDFVVDVCDLIKAPSRPAQVKKDATQQKAPLRCGGLSDFFSDVNIITCLCAARIKVASLRHEKQFFSSILYSETSEDLPLCSNEAPLLPERNQWSHYRPYHNQRRSVSRPNLQSLIDATLRLRKKNPDLPWNKNLEAKIAAINSRVFEPDFAFLAPQIHPQHKKEVSIGLSPRSQPMTN